MIFWRSNELEREKDNQQPGISLALFSFSSLFLARTAQVIFGNSLGCPSLFSSLFLARIAQTHNQQLSPLLYCMIPGT